MNSPFHVEKLSHGVPELGFEPPPFLLNLILRLLRQRYDFFFGNWLAFYHGNQEQPDRGGLDYEAFLLGPRVETVYEFFPRGLQPPQSFFSFLGVILAFERFRKRRSNVFDEVLDFFLELFAFPRGQLERFRLVLVGEVVHITPVRRHGFNTGYLIHEVLHRRGSARSWPAS